MRDRDPKQLNKDELVDVKSLVKDAEPSALTLDEILAEYGVPPRSRQGRGEEPDNVVAFPGRRVPEEEPSEEPEEAPPQEEGEEEE